MTLNDETIFRGSINMYICKNTIIKQTENLHVSITGWCFRIHFFYGLLLLYRRMCLMVTRKNVSPSKRNKKKTNWKKEHHEEYTHIIRWKIHIFVFFFSRRPKFGHSASNYFFPYNSAKSTTRVENKKKIKWKERNAFHWGL